MGTLCLIRVCSSFYDMFASLLHGRFCYQNRHGSSAVLSLKLITTLHLISAQKGFLVYWVHFCVSIEENVSRDPDRIRKYLFTIFFLWFKFTNGQAKEPFVSYQPIMLVFATNERYKLLVCDSFERSQLYTAHHLWNLEWSLLEVRDT